MLQWIQYSVRLLAALIMCSAAAVMAFIAMSSPESRLFSAATAAVFGGAGYFSWPRRPHDWRRDAPTQRQLEYAEALGIVILPGATKGQVSDMISEVTGR